MGKTKAQLQADLHLDELPSDNFMRLLATAGDADEVDGPAIGPDVPHFTPAAIEQAVIDGTVGELLATARQASGRSLNDIGIDTGVTRSRIQQIERSENIEVATLVRFAGACGYDVSITLRAREVGQPSITTVLGVAA